MADDKGTRCVMLLSLGPLARRFRETIGNLVGAAAVFYFLLHMIQGDRGAVSWWRMHNEVSRAESVLQKLEVRRSDLEHRVSLLRPDGIDPDLLEERARLVLNMGRPHELVIRLPPALHEIPDG